MQFMGKSTWICTQRDRPGFRSILTLKLKVENLTDQLKVKGVVYVNINF